MSWRFESCNVFFRRRALLASDGFDEIVGDSWEDTAAGFSVLAGGWRPAFAADAVVYHDVTYPGFGWHLRRERRQANAARIVRRYPAARRVFYLGLFANARGAAQLLALATPALARRHRAAALLALPYAAHLARMVRPADMARLFLLDLELHAQFVRGALRERTLLL